MTKKDFELIAATLKADAAHLAMPEFSYSQADHWQRGAYDQWNTTVLAFADVLKRNNPAFKRDVFLKAAGVQT